MGRNVDINEVMRLVRETRRFVENRDMAGHIKVKGLADYVTQVDTNIQNFLQEKLYERYPEVEFLGEEDGLHAMKGDTFWILDPIDGTTNLVHDYQPVSYTHLGTGSEDPAGGPGEGRI